MARNIVLINNSPIKGGMYTYAIQLMTGLLKLERTGEVDKVTQIVPNFAVHRKNIYIPRKIATQKRRFESHSFYLDECDAAAYEKSLKDATDIIIIAHVMNDGLDCLGNIPDCRVYVVFHSGLDLINLKRKAIFSEVSSLRHSFVTDLILYRRGLLPAVDKIAEIYSWSHLKRVNIIHQRMGYEVNPNPTEFLSRPNNFVWMGRARNLQKRFTRILNAYDSWAPMVNTFKFLTDLSSDVAHWSDVSDFKKRLALFDKNKYDLIDGYEPDDVQGYVKDCRIGVIPSQYPEAGFPLEWVMQELMANKVVVMSTRKIQEESDKYSPIFKFITFDEGWDPIDFSILDEYSESDLKEIAEDNYKHLRENHSCADMARNILN